MTSIISRKRVSRIRSILPVLDSLREYSPAAFYRDAIAGLTVALVAVPQAMAYAMIFGMPVAYGLYTAIVMTAVAAIFSPSKLLINGPTNAISIAMLSALAVVPEDQRVTGAILMALLIGLIQLGVSFLRLGDLTRYISQSVIVGFTIGASVLLILDQSINLLGLPRLGHGNEPFLMRIAMTLTAGNAFHWGSVGIGLLAIVTAMAIRTLNRRRRWMIPELLTAIVVVSFVAWFADMASRGLRMVEAVSQGLPAFSPPAWDWTLARDLAGSATVIAMLGLLEAVAMAKSLAIRNRQKLDMNQLCLSEGLANLTGSLFQCFPGSGSLTRSHINQQAGAATQFSAILCALGVALTVWFLGDWTRFIPRAALAGVLILTGCRMIELRVVRYHIRTTRFDSVIVWATALAAILISIEYCIVIGTLLSFLFYVPRAAQVEMNELIQDRDNAQLIRKRMPNDSPQEEIRIFNFEGELFFGAGPEFESLLEDIEQQCGQRSPRIVLIRLKYVRNPDAVCVQILERFLERIEDRGIVVYFSGLRPAMVACLRHSGLFEKIGAERIFVEHAQTWSSTLEALRGAQQKLAIEPRSQTAG